MGVDGLKERGQRIANGGGTGNNSPGDSPRPGLGNGVKHLSFSVYQSSISRAASTIVLDRPTAAVPAQVPRRHTILAVLSVLMLTAQVTAISIALRYSRTEEGKQYLASVAVLITEIIKLAICVVVQIWRCSGTQVPLTPSSASAREASTAAQQFTLSAQAWRLVHDALPMALPATMFVSQQVLLIVAAGYLDAVSYQVFNQAFKLVPTAVFAYWLLGQHLELVQWASLPVLAGGVILVTINNSPGSSGPKAVSQLQWAMGMGSCCISGLSSAFAGVYFERYVKGKLAASLWVRNIQLGVFAVPFGAAYTLLRDGGSIQADGWLQGFTYVTWIVVGLQVFGGLVTGMVVKYCDNVLKNFALAISVILTTLIAIPLFGQVPSALFLVGVMLVMLSVFMYSRSFNAQRLEQWAQSVRRAAKEGLSMSFGASHRRRRVAIAACAITMTLLLVSGMYGMQARLAAVQQGGGAAISLKKASTLLRGRQGKRLLWDMG